MKATPLVLLLILAGLFPHQLRAETNPPNLNLVRQLNETFVQIVEKVSPAVVVLTVTEKSTVFAEPTTDEGADQHEYWRKFHRQYDGEPQQGKGSGIVVRTNGYILTNRHVVEDAGKIQVRLFDGRTFTAAIRGIDPQSDVAVIKIEADNLPVARLGDSSKVRVGEFAVTVGTPLGLDYTATFGHISAKSRSDVIPSFLNSELIDQDFLQTDANINPGNSGGPLVNIDGEVIGMNTMIRGMNTGIGFAIPINLAREVSDKLIANGKFVRAWLGIEIRGLKENPEAQKRFQEIKDGVIVQSILTNGPAAKSDLRTNDIITAIDGKTVNTAQQLRAEVRGKAIGQSVNLDVYRAGRSLRLEIKPGDYTPTAPTSSEP